LLIFSCWLLNARYILTYHIVTDAYAREDNTGKGLYDKQMLCRHIVRITLVAAVMCTAQINSLQTFQLFRWCTRIFLCLQRDANALAGGQYMHVEEVSSVVYSVCAKKN